MSKTPLTLEEIQALCLDMLRFVDRICKAEHIQYFMSGGTLLGAVRHQGFIPWDDDIDLMMSRPDFERFLRVAPKYMDERYTMVHPRTQGDFSMPWARILDGFTHVKPSPLRKDGFTTLFVDIFPIDGLPYNGKLSKLFFKRIRFYDILLQCARRTKVAPDERLKWLKRPLMALARMRKPNSYANAMDRAAAILDFGKAKYAGVCVVTHYGERERMPAEVFRGSVPLRFCGESFPAPIGYETYLHGLYGDYMQLPPEDKRCSLHRIEAFVLGKEERK